jgi:hypothetical protein
MAAEMTLDARRPFLSEGTRTAVLATVREDGRPHASGRWSVWHQPGSSLVSGWVNIEMIASMRRIVPRRVSTRGECDALRCPEELTIPLESSSRRLVR